MDKQLTFEDTERTCVDCSKVFKFTAGEAFFYASKGLINPKRCPECRKQRKATIARPELEVRDGHQ
jgi:hypothetical protein